MAASVDGDAEITPRYDVVGVRRRSRRRKRGKKSSWNVNVKLALSFTFMSSASRGVWAFTTLSLYLQELVDSKTMVGVCEGIQGICQAVSAVIAGYVADKTRTDTVLHISGALGVIACIFTGYVLLNGSDHLEDEERFWLMTGALGVLGLTQGVTATCIDTLFADSVKTGQRSKFNTFRFALTQISSVTGPVVCVLLFAQYGNHWTMNRLRNVFFIGICLNLVPILLLFCMSDDHTLGRDSDSHYIPSTPGGQGTPYQRLVDEVLEQQEQEQQEESSTRLQRNRSRSADYARRQQQQENDGLVISEYESHWEEDDLDVFLTHHAVPTPGALRVPESSRNVEPITWLCFGQENIATILIISDVVSAIGSGLVVKFYSIFFKEKLHMSPIGLNTVYIILPIFMMGVSILAQRAAKHRGRIQVCLVLSYLGCFGLLGLSLVGKYMENNDWRLVIPIYFVSTCQHCSRPLRKSVLMDYVPKQRRGRFNSIDSITRLNWSGSAILGGMSIDKHGFGQLFLTTAMIQFVSATILFILVPLVPSKETARVAQPDEASEDEGHDEEEEAENQQF